jgi:hypothetical protein
VHVKPLIRSIGVTLGGATLLAAGLVVAIGTPANAAPPPNDTFAGSVTIESLPFSATLDTSEATTDADDAEANQVCGAPATDASVWYSYTAATDGALIVDVSRSSYPAGVLAVIGSPGTFEIWACGPSAIAFPTTAGTTYHLMIIDDQSDGGGNGGTMRLSIEEAPPPPVISATVSPSAGFNPSTGAATVRGTVTCTGIADFAFVDVELHQRVGRGEVVGFGTIDVLCDGSTQPWEIEVFPTIGRKFAGGKAASVTFAVACGLVDCSIDFQEHIVHLSRR